jgi:integrase
LYALAAYCCLRVGEAGALGVEDVDLERGRVRFHRAVDRATGEVGPTKTEDVRVLDVPKSTIPLLRALSRGGIEAEAGCDRPRGSVWRGTGRHDLTTAP